MINPFTLAYDQLFILAHDQLFILAHDQLFHQAYRACKKWVEKHGQEPNLPGLNLAHDQPFHACL
jgi:hypothetical protein